MSSLDLVTLSFLKYKEFRKTKAGKSADSNQHKVPLQKNKCMACQRTTQQTEAIYCSTYRYEQKGEGGRMFILGGVMASTDFIRWLFSIPALLAERTI